MRRQRWNARGVWPEVLGLLRRLEGVDMKIVFLDSTVVRAHQHATGASKKSKQAIERSRGGLTTKIYVLCASETEGLEVRLIQGQAGDAPTGKETGSHRRKRQDKTGGDPIRKELEAKGVDVLRGGDDSGVSDHPGHRRCKKKK